MGDQLAKPGSGIMRLICVFYGVVRLGVMCLPVFLGNEFAVYSCFLDGWFGLEYCQVLLIC